MAKQKRCEFESYASSVATEGQIKHSGYFYIQQDPFALSLKKPVYFEVDVAVKHVKGPMIFVGLAQIEPGKTIDMVPRVGFHINPDGHFEGILRPNNGDKIKISQYTVKFEEPLSDCPNVNEYNKHHKILNVFWDGKSKVQFSVKTFSQDKKPITGVFDFKHCLDIVTLDKLQMVVMPVYKSKISNNHIWLEYIWVKEAK